MKMKFTSQKDILLENMNIVSKAVSQKGVTPEAECFYLKAEIDYLTLMANNGEISIKTRFEVEIEEEGSILLKAKTFFDIIRLMEDGYIKISVSDNNIAKIESGNTFYEIMGLDVSSFPRIERDESECKLMISQKELKEAIKKTYFSIGTDEKKATFAGALFEIENGYMKVVTLDGYRMSLVKKDIECDSKYKSYIIPGKSLNELYKILEETDEIMKIDFSDRGAFMKVEKYEFFTRLIDGDFFNYEQIIPEKSLIEAVIDRKKLGASLERCSLMITPDSREPVKMTFRDNEVEMLTVSRIGKIEDNVEIRKEGKDIEIGFNHKYLLDVLKNLEEDYLSLNFTNNLSPCIIKSLEKDDYLYLILPVRLKN